MSDAHEDDDWNITYEHVNPDDPMIAGPRWRDENLKLLAENQAMSAICDKWEREYVALKAENQRLKDELEKLRRDDDG